MREQAEPSADRVRPQRRGRVWILAACAVVGAWFVANKKWQLLQLDRAWAGATVERAEPIVAALEAHRRATGGYPESLEALTPRYLAALPAPLADPSGQGSRSWEYEPHPRHGYTLYVTTLHWVNSFDILIRCGTGGPDFEGRGHDTASVGSWTYVVGGSALRERPDLY